MARDDLVQLGQRLDLVHDHPAQLRCAFGRFLRQLEHAAAQLLAGSLDLALHFGGHLPHRMQHVGEAFGRAVQHRFRLGRGLPEQRVRLGRCLLVEAVQGFHRALPLLLRGHANALMMLGDSPGALGACFRDDARDVARAPFRRHQRFVEQAGEPLEPLIEIGGAAVQRVDDRIHFLAPRGD